MALRNLRRKDWLALAAPLAITLIAALAIGHEHGWLSGLVTLTLFTSAALWMWRRRLRKLRDENARPWL